MKLSHLGQNLEIKTPKALKIKIILILGIVIFYLLNIILAYSDSKYWLYQYKNFSLLSLLFIINYSMQAYILYRQIRKSLQKYWINLAYWTITVLFQIIQIIVIQTTQNQTSTIILQVIIIISNIAIIIISLFFQKGRLTKDLQETLKDDNTFRSLQKSRSTKVPASNRLYIQFNREFQVTQKKQGLLCEFKFAVYLDDKPYILNKTDNDFLRLAQEMMKIFPTKKQVILSSISQKYNNMMKYGQEMQKIYQNYLIQLTKTSQFFDYCLLDFLCIPSQLKSQFLNKNNSLRRQDTGQSQQQQISKVPFFYVSYQNGKIVISNPDILELLLNKTNQQIQSFHIWLLQQKKITLQLLPQNPHETEILSFVDSLVNKRYLWKHFAAWFHLDVRLQNKIYNLLQPWNHGFRQIKPQIVGHEIVFDKQGKVHTYYLLSLSKKGQQRSEVNNKNILKKRYSDFCTLDKNIRRYLQKLKRDIDCLAPLPPKFSPFGSKTSPKSRQVRFDIYMKQLFRIQEINHCIKLLQFLQLDVASQNKNAMSSIKSPVDTNNLFVTNEKTFFGQFSQNY